MTNRYLAWMKQETLNDLNSSIGSNLERYKQGDFSDLVDSSWQQKELLRFDSQELSLLVGDSKDDLIDSLRFYKVFEELPARLATHMNVWVPLIHTELLDYARKRWLKMSGTDEDLINSIRTHFFKGGVGGYRDDNAAGRLWWTGFIGSRIARSGEVSEIEKILKPFMRTTDTRQNVFERSGIFAELGLARNISEYISEGRHPSVDGQQAFRSFMVNINLRSNGRYFGDLSKEEVFEFLDTCQ